MLDAHHPGARGRGDLRSPLAMFQVVLLTTCALLIATSDRQLGAMALLLPLSLGCWAAYRVPRLALAWSVVGALLAALGVPWTGGASSPLLPYLLTTGLALGLTGGFSALVLAEGALAGVLLAGSALHHRPGGAATDAVAAAEWVLLSLAVGLVGIWSQRLARPPVHDEYGEARRLLEQLRGLTRRLSGGLDAASAAEALLDRCWRVAPHHRAAVVVEPHDGAFVPLAVTGASRVPWRAPRHEDGPLKRAWTSGTVVLDRRQPDQDGRRHGSALLAVPLLSSGGPFGLVILESYDHDAFSDAEVEALRVTVDDAAGQLETAVLFEEVRREAGAEERDRLAREMHDGIAQDLAYVGYQLDDLRVRATRTDEGLGQQIAEVRQALTGMVSDLRLSITDLRTTVRPSQGLGAALSSYLRAVCSQRGLLLTLSLHESAFRLPAECEVALLRAAQAYAQHASRAPGAGALAVRLVVDPPSALLALSSDRLTRAPALDEVLEPLTRLGASLSWHGTGLDIRLEGDDLDDHGAAGRRPRADQAGPPARLRAH